MFDSFPGLTAVVSSYSLILSDPLSFVYAVLHDSSFYAAQGQFKRPEKVLDFWTIASRISLISLVLSLISIPIFTTDAMRLHVAGAVLSSNDYQQMIVLLNADSVLAIDINSSSSALSCSPGCTGSSSGKRLDLSPLRKSQPVRNRFHSLVCRQTKTNKI